MYQVFKIILIFKNNFLSFVSVICPLNSLSTEVLFKFFKIKFLRLYFALCVLLAVVYCESSDDEGGNTDVLSSPYGRRMHMYD